MDKPHYIQFDDARSQFYRLLRILRRLGLPDVYNDNSLSKVRGAFTDKYLPSHSTLPGRKK